MNHSHRALLTGIDADLINKADTGITLQYRPQTIQNLVYHRFCHWTAIKRIFHYVRAVPMESDTQPAPVRGHLEADPAAIVICQW